MTWTSIWNGASTTPAATHRVPVDVSSSGGPTRWTGQQIADLRAYVGGTVNNLGSIGTNQSLSLADGLYIAATITGNVQFTFTSVPTGFTDLFLELTNAGAHTVSFAATIGWTGGTTPSLPAVGVALIHLYTRDGGTSYIAHLVSDEQQFDAAAIVSGTLDAARLPAPGTTTLGGVKRNTGSAGQFVTGIDTDGSLLRDTPAGALQTDYYAAGTSGTWSKHPSAKIVRVIAVGGGGGGAGGDWRNAGTALRGGGAGGAGCIVDITLLADQLGTTEAYSVGSGGTGSAGASSVGAGTDGTDGGNTTFGTTFLVSKGGERGYNGGGSGNSRINGCFIQSGLHSTTNGGTGSDGTGNPGGAPSATTGLIPTAGGGGGGMNSTSTVIGAGGAGGRLLLGFTTHVMSANPASAGGATDGGDGGHGVSMFGVGWGGGGGGCGSVDGTIRGGDGGNGGFPGGSGGGGGGARGVRGGNGGNGGGGMLLVIQH